jgi:hypothetical protein
MLTIKCLRQVAFVFLALAAVPACSSESGDRATTDVSAGSNEAGARTNDSGGEMDAAAADTSATQNTGGTAGQGTEPAAGSQPSPGAN